MPNLPPAPQGANGGGAPPQPAPPGGQQGAGSNLAQQSVSMIKQGFQGLGKLMQAAGPNLDPQDMKLFQSALQATDTLLQSLMSPAGEKAVAPAAKAAPPGGPMPMNANAQAKPMPQ